MSKNNKILYRDHNSLMYLEKDNISHNDCALDVKTIKEICDGEPFSARMPHPPINSKSFFFIVFKFILNDINLSVFIKQTQQEILI